MPLPVAVDSLDKVPEGARSAYVERDGKFVLDVDQESVESTFVPGLKSALANERKAATDRGKQLEAWAKLGITPDQAKTLLDAQQEAERKKAEAAGEWDQLKQQLSKKHEEEKQALEQQIQSLASNINTLLIDNEAERACRVLKGESTLLLPVIRSRTKVVEDNGRHVVRVLDKDGNPRLGGADGAFMTIEQYVAELKGDPVYGRAFDGSGASGSGAGGGTGGTGGAGTGKISKRSDLKTEADKLAFIKANGFPAFRDLPD